MPGPVVVTGAAGRLGQELCRQLLEQKANVRAADRVVAPGHPLPIRHVDALDAAAVQGLLDGAWAVVHLANYTHASAAEPRRLFNENVAMNMNVFHSACQAGVRQIVFASSIQVVSGNRTVTQGHCPSCLPYLPLDGQTPACPGNAYALSKYVGEVTLRYYVDKNPGLGGTCIRFPMLVSDADSRRLAATPREPEAWHILDQGFAMLSYADAAGLIRAVLARAASGFRVYLPAARENMVGQPPARLIERYYGGVSLRRPAHEIESLVDISQITEETGWKPTGFKPSRGASA